MGRKKGSVNKKEELIQPLSDSIDELLSAELLKIKDMKEPGKSSAIDNLNRYFNAMRKSKE